MVSSSMTFSDPNPGFKVTVYLEVDYLKRCVLATKPLEKTNEKNINELSNDTTLNDLE